jgi:hypothetical protein
MGCSLESYDGAAFSLADRRGREAPPMRWRIIRGAEAGQIKRLSASPDVRF